MRHPRLYPWITDDFAPPRENFTPVRDPNIWYVMAGNAGMLMFLPQNMALWEVHCCLLPGAWGGTRRIAQESHRWLFSQVESCQRIICAIPKYNRLAIALASDTMQQYGVNPRSFRKWGKMHDLVLFGVNR